LNGLFFFSFSGSYCFYLYFLLALLVLAIPIPTTMERSHVTHLSNNLLLLLLFTQEITRQSKHVSVCCQFSLKLAPNEQDLKLKLKRKK